MTLKDEYINRNIELMKSTNNIALLDLIMQLLKKSNENHLTQCV